MQSKPASHRSMTVSQMYDAFQHMSWHLPGMYNLVQQDSVMGVRKIKIIKIPPCSCSTDQGLVPRIRTRQFL